MDNILLSKLYYALIKILSAMKKMSNYSFLISEPTLIKIQYYRNRIETLGIGITGKYFQDNLTAYLEVTPYSNLKDIPLEDFIHLLIQTKKPRVFAESEVKHDNSDWTYIEESILGDITVNMPVEMFNDGGHAKTFNNHPKPIPGILAYVPGALLRSDQGGIPADKNDVTLGSKINTKEFMTLYERRLLPQLLMINEQAAQQGKKAAITMPGIGTGQFAGNYRDEINAAFENALRHLITMHADKLPNIDVFHYDPYKGNQDTEEKIGHIKFRVRPFLNTKSPRTGQLEYPSDTNENTHLLASFVAWDHFSYPGNDYLAGARATDDGVKGASTDTLAKITDVTTAYDPEGGSYSPPKGSETWEDYIYKNHIKLEAPIVIATKSGELRPLRDVISQPLYQNVKQTEFTQNNVKEFLLQVLDTYKKEREAYRNPFGDQYKYTFFGLIGFGFSKTQKLMAVDALVNALNGEDVQNLGSHLAALRNGELGNAIRAVLKSYDTSSFLEEKITTVSGLVDRLENETKYLDLKIRV